MLDSPHSAVRYWALRWIGDPQKEVSEHLAHRLDEFAEQEPDVWVRQQLAISQSRELAIEYSPPIPAEEREPSGALGIITILVDGHGLLLAGAMAAKGGGGDVADAVAAEVAGVAREASRATRLLELGAWKSIAMQSDGTQLRLLCPTADTVLLARSEGDVPGARLAVAAERAAQAARRWLERSE